MQEGSNICGIIGAVGNITVQGRKMVKLMLLLDQVRGFNSTGIACIDDDDVFMYKKAVHSTDFLELKDANSLLDCHKNKAIIGHNRAATKGAVTNANAHPFNHGKITGVHNGTLRVQSLLPDYKEFDVDSDNIFYSIDKIGVDETIKKLNGAYTLAWWDEEEDTINLVRNTERPMTYAYSEDGKTFFYASEAWMLVVSAERCGVKIGKVFTLSINTLMTFDLGVGYNKFTTLLNTRVKTREVTPYIVPVKKAVHVAKKPQITFTISSVVRSHGSDTFHGTATDGNFVEMYCWDKTAHAVGDTLVGTYYSTKWVSAKKTYVTNDYSMSGMTKNQLVMWGNRQITRLQRTEKLAKGCSWCGDVTNSNDYLVVDDGYLCGGCKSLGEVQDYINEV